jgi:hypothetical protein
MRSTGGAITYYPQGNDAYLDELTAPGKSSILWAIEISREEGYDEG